MIRNIKTVDVYMANCPCGNVVMQKASAVKGEWVQCPKCFTGLRRSEMLPATVELKAK
jgi:hypothetical protein